MKKKKKPRSSSHLSSRKRKSVRSKLVHTKKVVSAPLEWVESLAQNIWPIERDFFERPERYHYVRKLLPAKECVFCVAEKAEVGVQSLVLMRDEHCQVVMNKYPYNTGHLLVMPRAHVGNLAELDDKTNLALAAWLKKCVIILKKEMSCQGFNLGLNQGAVAGAGIPDLMHWHIVPRWNGDTNFFPLIAQTKVLPETLEQTYSRLKKYFEAED